MEGVKSFFQLVRQAPTLAHQQAVAYRTHMTQNPEECQRKALVGTIALGVIALAGTALAVKFRSLSSAAFTPMVTVYSQAAWLIYSFNRTPENKTDETIAKDMKLWIRYSLVALSVLGAGATTVLLNKLSGFAALFALLTGGTAAALAHFESAPIVEVRSE